MSVSKSGYYKWRNADETTGRTIIRTHVIELVMQVHLKHPSHGYRWVNAFIYENYGEKYSDNYIYNAFRYLDITAQTKHRVKYRKRVIKDKYPNLIFSSWETVDKPRQVIVSDMTAFTVYKIYYELTLYFDVFTKEILSWELTTKRGDRNQYIDGLQAVVNILDELNLEYPTVVHTDQGSVYASVAYNDLIKDINIIRSMSRAGKPTDNPVNESLNGWIKEELFMDFGLAKSHDVRKSIEYYIDFYNNKRPCYSIGYHIPAKYYEMYTTGQIEKKNTFENRIITEVPKFVQKRKAAKNKKD